MLLRNSENTLTKFKKKSSSPETLSQFFPNLAQSILQMKNQSILIIFFSFFNQFYDIIIYFWWFELFSQVRDVAHGPLVCSDIMYLLIGNIWKKIPLSLQLHLLKIILNNVNGLVYLCWMYQWEFNQWWISWLKAIDMTLKNVYRYVHLIIMYRFCV